MDSFLPSPKKGLDPALAPERFSCRIYGVLRRGGEVLLTRSRFVDRQFVNFPGGGVDLGEGPIEALRREYREETGLSIDPVRVLYASEAAHISTQAPMQIVSIYWLVEKTAGILKVGGNNEDVLSLFWAPLASIPTEEMFPSDLEFARRLPDLL
ncbi:MAG: NUDIX hydrolase [Elusimicrobia bacterium]|nr:NUDIX hydrolase [Elusimicrobiota bacterium]